MRFPVLTTGFVLLAVPAAAREHWAYQPPVVVPAEGAAHPIDALLAGAWEKAGIGPAPLAPPRRWVERAAYTLTGLPASPEQLRRIEENPDDATWRALIDEFLASPAYGERWARHWMDVARYADTQGYNFDQDNRYPFAYTYRDWLIRAFNGDMPYGDFIKLQLAADLLTDRPDDPDLAALGFLTVGPRGGRVETIDDRVDVVTRGFLSSTVACARCHDHKSDPITMRDYYSLYSILDNTDEPGEKPVIGKPADEAAFQAFAAEMGKLDEADRAARQVIVDQLRTPESLAIYLELAWRAGKENWDMAAATSEGFKRGRYRATAILRWRDFLKKHAAIPRLASWTAAMENTDAATTCLALAKDWTADGDLMKLAGEKECPLSYDIHRVAEIFDQEDGNQSRKRAGDRTRLLTEHAGSPPRAMNLSDRANRALPRIFLRGNPNSPGETIDLRWLGFLGGGPFADGKSPRLSLAEKIADPANPLTARVIVNRVWAWHFGEALADPGDFGVQQSVPPLRALLDQLALRFNGQGGSLKELHRLILTSKAFRLAADGPLENARHDEANRLFWKWNRRRADFESARDRLLDSASSLDHAATGGRSFSLESAAGDGRRSLYAFVDRYALSGTLVSFDLPHPDHHSPRRVETTVPQQALYYLNGPLVLRQAAKLAAHPEFRALPDDKARVAWLYRRIYQRDASADELREATAWIGVADPAAYQPRLSGTWEVRHVPDDGRPLSEASAFPLHADGVWKTGPDPATAPIRWLNAGPGGGHAAAGHLLVLRWKAQGSGEVRMTGNIARTQKEGVPLAWEISHNGTRQAERNALAPEGSAELKGEWLKVAPGDTVDFLLSAPHGDSCGGVSWNLRVMGRETPQAKPEDVGNFRRQFPTPDSPPPAPAASDPWTDLIQMLWASNEFHFID